MGIFSRAMDRLRSVAADDDPAPVHVPAAPRGDITPIGEAGDRQRVTVQGRVTAMTLPTKMSAPALVLDVADATGSLELVFVGRRAIPGIETGVALRASGRVSTRGARRIIYNPAYEIVPLRDH